MASSHGTVGAYRKGCRCDHCRAAATAAARRRRARRLQVEPPEHGASGYTNYGCRCDTCREAWSDASRERNAAWRARTAERAEAGERPQRHGVAGYIFYGCRCSTCTAASARANSQRNAPTVDGAARRGHEWTGPELELAARDDLTAVEIARMLGRTRYAVTSMRYKLRREPAKQRLAGQRKDNW